MQRECQYFGIIPRLHFLCCVSCVYLLLSKLVAILIRPPTHLCVPIRTPNLHCSPNLVACCTVPLGGRQPELWQFLFQTPTGTVCPNSCDSQIDNHTKTGNCATAVISDSTASPLHHLGIVLKLPFAQMSTPTSPLGFRKFRH